MDPRAKLLHLKDFHHHRRRRQINLLRLRDFHIDEHRRQVNQLQAMIADFERLAAQLELEIQAEEDRTKIIILRMSPIRPWRKQLSYGARISINRSLGSRRNATRLLFRSSVWRLVNRRRLHH